MAHIERQVRAYGGLGLLLFVVAVLAGTIVTSCGGGGGKSNGALCEQCGDDPDGPCQPSVEYTPDVSLPPPCNSPVPDSTAGCTVHLICRRKSDSAQQRCYPGNPLTGDVNYQWRCDGSRPGGTAVPEPTTTPTEESTAQATATLCGNGIVDTGEDCDGSNNGLVCENFGCTTPLTGGGLVCTNACQFNFSGCTGSCVRR